ncbi:MAG: pilin [Patescibacteria group bacterium]
MKKITFTSVISFCFAVFLLVGVPLIAQAQLSAIIPCNGTQYSGEAETAYQKVYDEHAQFNVGGEYIPANRFKINKGTPPDLRNNVSHGVDYDVTYTGETYDYNGTVLTKGQTIKARFEGVDPSDGAADDALTAANDKYKECGFNDVVILIQNLINVMFTISIPLTVIAFTYVGILLLTAGGNASKVTQAKEIAGKVMIGFIIILSAWLIVYLITSTFLSDEFNMFLKP